MDKLDSWQVLINEYRYDIVNDEFFGENIKQGAVERAGEYGICVDGMDFVPVPGVRGKYYTAFEFDAQGALPTIENWKTLLWQMGHGRYTRDELADIAEACFIHGYVEIGSMRSSVAVMDERSLWRICTYHLPEECVPDSYRELDFTAWRIREYIAETVDDLLDSAAEQLAEDYKYETSVDRTLERIVDCARDDPDMAETLEQLGDIGDYYDGLE